MFSGLSGLTAMAVSFTGATFSQSVFTLAAVLDVVQIGPFAFLYFEKPTPFWAEGFGQDRANAGIGAATTRPRNVTTTVILLRLIATTPVPPTASPLAIGASARRRDVVKRRQAWTATVWIPRHLTALGPRYKFQRTLLERGSEM